MYFKRRVPHTYFLREDGTLWEERGGVIPLDNFASVILPEVPGKDLFEDWLVQLPDLPPGVGGMLVLDLDDSDPSPRGIQEQRVGLAPAPLPIGEELEPGIRHIAISVKELHMLMYLFLIPHTFKAPACITLLPNRRRKGQARSENPPGWTEARGCGRRFTREEVVEQVPPPGSGASRPRSVQGPIRSASARGLLASPRS